MLLFVLLVVQDGGSQAQGELVAKAPGHSGGQEGVRRPGALAPGITHAKGVERVGGPHRHLQAEDVVVELLEATPVPAETESDILTALLTANSGAGVTLDDGNALFHTTHGNVAGSGGAITTTTLSAARLAMRSQDVALVPQPCDPPRPRPPGPPAPLIGGVARDAFADQMVDRGLRIESKNLLQPGVDHRCHALYGQRCLRDVGCKDHLPPRGRSERSLLRVDIERAVKGQDIGVGSAIAVALMAVSLVPIVIYLTRVFRRGER